MSKRLVSIFRLAHLSDLHLEPPPRRWLLRELASKRLLSLASWRRKRRATHRRRILEEIVADVRAYAPDHVAITGDLTNFSTTEEFEAARTWLEQLGPAREVTVSPGNHDALVAAGLAERFAGWRPWLGDAAEETFPRVRLRGGVAIVNLCSAAATPPLSAQGRLGKAQIARLAAALQSLGGRGLFRVVMLHHPVAPGTVSKRKALVDQADLRAALKAHGAELVLHGHAHEAAVGATPGPDGAIPLLGVPSASASPGGHGPAARWHAIEIGNGEIRVTARGYAAGGERIEELGRYRLV